jgi:NADH-quinone oxidoreductase subunit N
MAAAVKAAAFVAFLRVFLTAFPGLYDAWGGMIFWLAAITMVGANLVALTQDNVKRMLAYSSIAHAGYLLVALAAASALGAASFLFYLLVYTLMTLGIFGVIVLVGREGEAHVGLEAYSGLAWRRPLLGLAMTVFLLSLAGFPLTGGFIAKVYVLQAAVERNLLPLAILLVLASLVSYWYYLRVAWYMWFRESTSASADDGIVVPPAMRVALVAAVAGILLLGVFPGAVLELAQRSAFSLMSAPTSFVGAGAP